MDEILKKPKKKISKRLISIIIIIIILSIITLCLRFTGYIPLFNETREPIGNYETVNTQKYIEEYPAISEMPNLDKIEQSAWKTDETFEQVMESYKNNLLKDGYSLEYDGKLIIEEKEYHVLGFLKGLTAVGILISLDENPGDPFESEILYVTGNALDFIEIIKWYQNQ